LVSYNLYNYFFSFIRIFKEMERIGNERFELQAVNVFQYQHGPKDCNTKILLYLGNDSHCEFAF